MKRRKVKKGIWSNKKKREGEEKREERECEDHTLDGLDCNGGVTGYRYSPPTQWVQVGVKALEWLDAWTWDAWIWPCACLVALCLVPCVCFVPFCLVARGGLGSVGEKWEGYQEPGSSECQKTTWWGSRIKSYSRVMP